MLAEEIGKEARGIDEGFTEDRSDVKLSYLGKVEPLEEKYGEGGTEYDDYIRTRDLAAKDALSAWQTASTAYEAEKKRYEELHLPGIIDPIGGEAQKALGDISTRMMELITTQISGTDYTEADPTFDPFAPGGLLGGYEASQFGLMDDTYYFTGLPDMDYESFYTPYKADPGLKLYDPEVKMPWDDTTTMDFDPLGEGDKPGGRPRR